MTESGQVGEVAGRRLRFGMAALLVVVLAFAMGSAAYRRFHVTLMSVEGLLPAVLLLTVCWVVGRSITATPRAGPIVIVASGVFFAAIVTDMLPTPGEDVSLSAFCAMSAGLLLGACQGIVAGSGERHEDERDDPRDDPTEKPNEVFDAELVEPDETSPAAPSHQDGSPAR